MQLASLAAPEVVILTTSGAANDENVVKDSKKLLYHRLPYH